MKIKQVSAKEAKIRLFDNKEDVLCLNTAEENYFGNVEMCNLAITDVTRALVLLGKEDNTFFVKEKEE